MQASYQQQPQKYSYATHGPHHLPTCIPNQFYILADRINCLEKMIGASISKCLEMANSIIEAGGTVVKISSTATGVEIRLERESNR